MATSDEQRAMPKLKIADVYKFLGTEKNVSIYRTEWKDSIDINVPAYGLQALVEHYVALDRQQAPQVRAPTPCTRCPSWSVCRAAKRCVILGMALAANPQQSNGEPK